MENRKIIAQNRKARFNYAIQDTFEAGIVLCGSEVKSLRTGKSNIAESFAVENHGELFLHNSYIAEYEGANRFNHESRRPRKLLLKKRELNKLIGAIKRKGITIVPLSLYFNKKGKVKVELAIAQGKEKADKRATIKEREWQRDKARIFKGEK